MVGSAPAALPARTPPGRPVAAGRAAGWSTASVLGHGAGPGGAPTATDVVAALGRGGSDDSLSGAALFTGVVPPEPPPPVDDDPPPPVQWDVAAPPPPAEPPVSAPAATGPGTAGPGPGGGEPHPWFGGGLHARPDGTAPTAGARPGPGRHTTPPAAPTAPQNVAPQLPPVPQPRTGQVEPATPVDRVVAAVLQGAGSAPRPSSARSLFEPPPRPDTDRPDTDRPGADVRRGETDVSAVRGRQDSTPVGLGVPGARTAPDDAVPRGTPPGTGPADTGRDGGNRVDPGR